MGKFLKQVFLDAGYAPTSSKREGHIAQKRRLEGDAIRSLQEEAQLARGQAIAMIDPKSGSRCRGLKVSL